MSEAGRVRPGESPGMAAKRYHFDFVCGDRRLFRGGMPPRFDSGWGHDAFDHVAAAIKMLTRVSNT
jgi:hypothetical protein